MNQYAFIPEGTGIQADSNASQYMNHVTMIRTIGTEMIRTYQICF